MSGSGYTVSQCQRCKFEVVLDDVEIDLGEGRCLCLRCYARATHEEKAMPRDLREDVRRSANQHQDGTP